MSSAQRARRRPRRGTRRSTRRRRRARRREVAEQLAAAGDDVEGVAGVQDGRTAVSARGRAGRGGGDRLGGRGEGEQRVAAVVGRRARVRGAARARSRWSVPAALRRTTTASSPSRRQLARPRSTGRRRSPRTVRHGRTGRSATPRRRRAAARPRRSLGRAGRARAGRRARARRRPSCRSSPSREPLALARRAAGGRRGRRRCRGGRAAAAALARAGQADQQVGRMVGRGAGRRARSRLVGRSAATTAAHSSAPWTSPLGERDGDERLELAHRPLAYPAAAACTQGSIGLEGTLAPRARLLRSRWRSGRGAALTPGDPGRGGT